MNYGAAVHADKWIPVLPNTDAALQLAIAYLWIKEGTYDKEYVATHVVGFDKFSDYVMGKEDGIPKTPEWASGKCGVPEWTIKALAREFAKKRTSIAHYFGGGYVRGPYSHEPGRLEVCLLGMQGLGKPGVHQHQLTYFGMPRMEGLAGTSFWNPEIIERLSLTVLSSIANWQESALPKTLVHTHLQTEGTLKFNGVGSIEGNVANQFKKYTFPLPGQSPIKMIWTDTPCRTTCWNGGNATETALGTSQVECIVAQHPWLENDCLFSDIILPANTHMEVDDIVTNVRQGGQFADVMLCEKAVEPVGESKSDYEIVYEIAKKLGLGEQVSENLTTEEIQHKVFGYMALDRFMTWEEFKDKKYYLYQVAKDWEADPAGFRKFYENPEKSPLGTPSHKLEFYSERLAKHFPDDKERPPNPQWIEKSEMHDERLSSPRAKLYPLLLMSNHGRWRVHAQCTLRNRLVMSAACTEYGTRDGFVTERLVNYYAERAKGETGLIFIEVANPFYPSGKVLLHHLAINDDKYIPGLKKLTKAIHGYGSKTILQVSHAGRQTTSKVSGQQPWAPSGLLPKISMYWEVPREMTIKEIKSIPAAFDTATERAKKAGFDGVELHAAHGYLMTSFISPYTNKRTDDYGGSLENRMRLPMETLRAMMKHQSDDILVTVRMNGDDYVEGGVDLDEAKVIARPCSWVIRTKLLISRFAACGETPAPEISAQKRIHNKALMECLKAYPDTNLA